MGREKEEERRGMERGREEEIREESEMYGKERNRRGGGEEMNKGRQTKCEERREIEGGRREEINKGRKAKCEESRRKTIKGKEKRY